MPLARSGSKGSEGEIRHVRTLLDRGVHPTAEALHWAVRQARPGMVTLLLDRGEERGWLTDCYVDFPDFDPLAASLRTSLTSLEIDLVALLLERGADPDARYAGGTTPLMLLAREVSLKQAQAGAPHPDADADGELPSPSPYHEKWFAPLFRLLMEHGADLGLRDDAGRTAADHVPDDDHDRAIKRALLTPSPSGAGLPGA
jgi:ankyrin repeat protein